MKNQTKNQTMFTALQEKIQHSSIQHLEITRQTEKNVRFQVHMLVTELQRENPEYVLSLQYMLLIEELIFQWLKTEQKKKRLAKENRLMQKLIKEVDGEGENK